MVSGVGNTNIHSTTSEIDAVQNIRLSERNSRLSDLEQKEDSVKDEE
tara:strand:- start:435 stop:575 length:141 start_codon:yes stop_codon:yes gene_type:complete